VTTKAESRKLKQDRGVVPLYLLSALLLVFSLQPSAFSQSVKCAWDICEQTNVSGYKVLSGPASGIYTRTNAIDGRLNNTALVTNLPAGATFLAVVAVLDGGLESDLSNEVAWTNKAFAPRNFRLSATMQASRSAGGPWTNLATLDLPLPPLAGAQFYRSKLVLEPSP